MPFIDTRDLEIVERLPGWLGRYFQSSSMFFAHYEFTKGSSIHEHTHPQEEVWQVIEGQLEVTIEGVSEVARPGMVAVVLPGAPHSARALTDGWAIVADYPLRDDFLSGGVGRNPPDNEIA
jgi:quercetin dioxygenase-like cupin family protein